MLLGLENDTGNMGFHCDYKPSTVKSLKSVIKVNINFLKLNSSHFENKIELPVLLDQLLNRIWEAEE